MNQLEGKIQIRAEDKSPEGKLVLLSLGYSESDPETVGVWMEIGGEEEETYFFDRKCLVRWMELCLFRLKQMDEENPT